MFSTIFLTLHSKVSPADVVYQEANGLLNTGKYLDAIEKYTEAIKLDSRHLEAYANRGLSYTSIPDFFRATNADGELIDPDQPAWDLAIDDFTVAIELDQKRQHPEIALLFMNRGFAYGNFNKPEESLADYNTAIQIRPDFAEAYCNRALLHYKQDRFDLAETDFQKVLELSPSAQAEEMARDMLEKLSEMTQQSSTETITLDESISLDSPQTLTIEPTGDADSKSISISIDEENKS